MIDNSVLKRLAIQQFGTVLVQGKEYFELDEEGLQAFAEDIIAQYKAGLVSTEFDNYTNDSARLDWLQNNVDSGFTRENIDKVMLPSGETK